MHILVRVPVFIQSTDVINGHNVVQMIVVIDVIG